MLDKEAIEVLRAVAIRLDYALRETDEGWQPSQKQRDFRREVKDIEQEVRNRIKQEEAVSR